MSKQEKAREKELALENRQLVWIFLGLAVLCGVFFGLGYIVGTHTAPQQDIAQANVPSASSVEKPSSLPTPTYIPRNPAAAAAVETPSPPADTDLSFYQSVEENKPQPTLSDTAESAAAEAPAPEEQIEVVPPPAGLLVQISALSKREDAEGLVVLLREKNLPVLVTTGENDKLYHVVVGPYATEAEAQRAKQALEKDGFRPFIRR